MFDGLPRQWLPRRWMCVVATAIALILLLPSTSAAQFKQPTNPKAKKHLETGNRHYKLQDFKSAIKEYKAGTLIEDLPVFLYNLGQSYRQLGDYANAIWYYKRYLSQGAPTGARKKWVIDVIKDMEKELQRAARTKPPTAPGPSGPMPSAKTKTTPVANPAAGPSDNHIPWHSDKLGWAITTAGLVGLGLGGGMFLSASSLDDQADAEDDQMKREQFRKDADSRRTFGTVSSLVGAALIVGGVIRLISNPQPKRVKANVSLAIGARWVGVIGRF